MLEISAVCREGLVVLHKHSTYQHFAMQRRSLVKYIWTQTSIRSYTNTTVPACFPSRRSLVSFLWHMM
ncbi:uncharacterized protein CCOS01_10709 [Colletotrichum costaricense]|uniref:Uncharacterized protein n=1 Tax=Colletotrichum costaricense TaxID=1209916 RepID=A0AAI9YR98_9PEZI|nr:uncharacterized protein CCOS01_10709 [Colletotrichum costaricense]KAK1520590.1 hypothetical protein CCOS01_10709 [Colletotrichum costaricense]